MTDKTTLYALIERYFDADTTPGEEKELLRMLLDSDPSDPKVSEALAVMGYARMMKKPSVEKPRRQPLRAMWRPALTVAASVAVVVLMIAGLMMSRGDAFQTGSYAYSGGERIENLQQIMSIVESQMSDMSEAQSDMLNEVSADLDDIRSAMNELNDEVL
ncbi:MAG: hypothetical protein K2M01_00830 [Paramuribaculum sp.]|nr:hypothetical protein [Paramuribaculum sp.]